MKTIIRPQSEVLGGMLLGCIQCNSLRLNRCHVGGIALSISKLVALLTTVVSVLRMFEKVAANNRTCTMIYNGG